MSCGAQNPKGPRSLRCLGCLAGAHANSAAVFAAGARGGSAFVADGIGVAIRVALAGLDATPLTKVAELRVAIAVAVVIAATAASRTASADAIQAFRAGTAGAGITDQARWTDTFAAAVVLANERAETLTIGTLAPKAGFAVRAGAIFVATTRRA